MDITVKLYGNLAKYLPPNTSSKEIKQSCPEGSTVHELLKAVKISPEEKIMLILVNSEEIMASDDGKNDELHHGDIVEIFPPIIGG